MRHCLSCNCPEEQPASFQDGLCEPCFLRLEKLRAPFKQYQIAAPIVVRSDEPHCEVPKKLFHETPQATAYFSSEAIGATLIVLGFITPSIATPDPLHFIAMIWTGGLLSSLGFLVILLTHLRRLIEPIQQQNAEMIQLLKKFAEQTALREFETRDPLSQDELPSSAYTANADEMR